VEAAAADIVSLYDHYYDRASFQTTPTVSASLERLVRSAQEFRRTSRWLDIGFGEGGVLAVAQERGWLCYGIELSERALEHGRSRGWVVTSDPSDDPRFEAGTFDVVSMIEFLEHVPTPARILRDAARWLRPGGLLYLTTPNLESLNGRLLGLSWSIVSPPEHAVLWTASALRSALSVAGFRVVRIRSEGLNPVELLARLRSQSNRAPVDRNQSAFALSEALSRNRFRRALKRVVNAGLSAFRLGDTVKVWALREG
jgi:SAM-dependent methyltransferase